MTLHFPELGTTEEAHSAQQVNQVIRSSRGQMKFAFYRDFAKPILEALAILVCSIFVLPVIAGMALLVATDGHSPFYSQKRIGLNGRVFRMWKMRTMVIDADACLAKYLAENPKALHEWTTTQKLKDDPRITPIGRILRKTSLDELPQLLNVLRGEMSLVGPRPMMVSQRTLYPGQAYYRLRPGITGLWQISKRNELSFAARADFDDLYERTLSFVTDLRILARTIGVVVRGTGY